MRHLALLAVAQAATVSRTKHGVSIRAASGDGPSLLVEVASSSSFRLGVRFDGWGDAFLPSISLDPARIPAPSTPVAWGGMVGVSTSFGALLAAADGSGKWALYDSANATLDSSGGSPVRNNASGVQAEAGVVLPVASQADLGPGQPCLGNGFFGPPFSYNREGKYLAFAVASSAEDPDYPHCYGVAFDGTIGSAEKATDYCDPAMRHDGYDVANAVRSSKFPDGLANTTYATCCAACNSASDCSGFVWSDGSHPAPPPQGNCWPLASFSGLSPTPGRSFGGVGPPPPQQAWWAMGPAADWYFAPVTTPLAFTKALYDLTGAPAIPPRWVLGFMITYWGYESMEFVEGNVTAFRDGQYPLDMTIMDYDWWNTGANANLDFGYDPKMFGHHDFIHPHNSTIPNATTDGPVELFQHLHRDLNVHFGGIRKPRTYSNIALSNASGWLLPDSWNVGAGLNNWNMTAFPSPWADWYVANHTHFLADGLDFWWNDEGETQWFTYSTWGQAQQQQYAEVSPGQRFSNLNRAFQPGMQRYPAITWTGDRQDCSHATVLTFTTAGQLYTACDMTAPSATVLVRQYQNAIFLPIMRVHAMHGVPRFPYLWGGEEHQVAFRGALNMRYHFIPHIYSLFHAGRFTGAPTAMPASYVFSSDPSFPPSIGDSTYMFSDVLLPADVSTANNADPNENVTHVNFPPGVWFSFNSTASVMGPQVGVTHTDVPLSTIELYVRAGAILTLNRDVVQWAGAQGGDLELQVYGGRDGAFTLVEDDGSSLSYQTDYDASTRRTSFVWTDASRTLSWTVQGGFSGGSGLYTTAWPVLFVANASGPVPAPSAALGVAGSVVFP